MKTVRERFTQRLRKNRPMTTISIRMPLDAIENLKEFAPKFGFSGYQPLIRAYVSQGMRNHEAELFEEESKTAGSAKKVDIDQAS